jgi:lysophospholipase L1-like esterase
LIRTQRIVFGLVAVLAAAFGIDVLLARIAIVYVHATDAVRLDPGGLKVYSENRAKEDDGGLPVLELFGDSRAAMWTEPPNVPGYRVANRGIARQTTAQLLLRFDDDVTALHPAVVVFEGGINDLKTIAEFPERRAEILADCKANLTTIVARSRRAGAQVVLLTIFDVGDVPLWRRPFWSTDVEAAVREVNAFLPQLTNDKVILLDANSALEAGPGQIRHEFQLDYLHLTAAGYAALSAQLVPLVSSLPR